MSPPKRPSYQRKILLSGSSDKTVRAWSLETFSSLKVLTGHSDEVHCVRMLSRFFVSGSEDKSLRIWDNVSFDLLLVIDHAHASGVFGLVGTGPDKAYPLSNRFQSSFIPDAQSTVLVSCSMNDSGQKVVQCW